MSWTGLGGGHFVALLDLFEDMSRHVVADACYDWARVRVVP